MSKVNKVKNVTKTEMLASKCVFRHLVNCIKHFLFSFNSN